MKKGVLITLVVILVFFVGAALGRFLTEQENNCEPNVVEKESDVKIDNIKTEIYNGKIYYIENGKYSGDYDYQEINLAPYYNRPELNSIVDDFNKVQLMTYDEYAAYIKKWNLTQKYTQTNLNYMVIAYAAIGRPIVKAELINVVQDNSVVNIYMSEDESGLTADVGAYVMVIPVTKSAKFTNINMTYTQEEFNNIKEFGTTIDPRIEPSLDKPVIYIYPTEDTNVTVRLGNSELITTSYPKYNNSWSVLARPDGSLKDLKTNKNYYALYWEGKNYNAQVKDDGFVVKGSDTISFLEEKLSILGLTEREINEFMMYWLPKLEPNTYNYIRFSTEEEINDYMPLVVTPQPDTIIRIAMTYKPLDNYMRVNEQKLTAKTRNGYTVIEWGGSLINN